jgi:spore germination protein GerM
MKRGYISFFVLILVIVGATIFYTTISKKKLSDKNQKVFVYFGKVSSDNFNCSEVFPFQRVISETQTPARKSLEELFNGPSDVEKSNGIYTSINKGVKIQKISIIESTAYVDFSEELEKSVGGSCRVANIRSQINSTLKQFSTIKDVVISINGRTEDILQP